MKKQTLFLALLAIGLLTATTFFGCSNDDDWAEDEYSTLANMKMTRSGETQVTQPVILVDEDDIPDSAIIFKNRIIECYGWITGVQYVGSVTFSGFVVKNQETNKYNWGLTKLTCSTEYVGNILFDISYIDSVHCQVYSSFIASQGAAAGINFVGQKDIRYTNYN